MSSTPVADSPILRNEEVTTSANGITVSLALAEPVVYLPQLIPANPPTVRPVMLSGHLRLRLTKAIKIKKVEVVFMGTAQAKSSKGR